MTLRLAFRTLLKAPFVTFVAILSLALGIGANTAISSAFDQILRRSLPVSEPARLVNFEAPPSACDPPSAGCSASTTTQSLREGTERCWATPVGARASVGIRRS
jgi:hypothetical protein